VASDESKGFVASRQYLVVASSILLAWNLVGIDLTTFHNDLIGFLAAIPKGVVPVVLIFVIAYFTFALFRDLQPIANKPKTAFIQALDVSITCLLAGSAIASYFSRLTGGQLVHAIQDMPTCLIFAAFGWTVIIPSAFALLRARPVVLSSEGLTILGPAMLGCGVLAIWLSVAIAGNFWPAWVGAWTGLLPGVLLVSAWRRREG
jgi:hypothetical protein